MCRPLLSESTESPPCLDLLQWSAVTLLEKEQLSPTCIRFRFGLVSQTESSPGAALNGTAVDDAGAVNGPNTNRKDATIGVSLAACGGFPGQHLDLRWEGVGASGPIVREYVLCPRALVLAQAVWDVPLAVSNTRPVSVARYTPISPLDQQGHFDLAVRIYPRPSGRMGQYLASLPCGAKLGCRGMQVRLNACSILLQTARVIVISFMVGTTGWPRVGYFLFLALVNLPPMPMGRSRSSLGNSFFVLLAVG